MASSFSVFRQVHTFSISLSQVSHVGSSRAGLWAEVIARPIAPLALVRSGHECAHHISVWGATSGWLQS